MARKHKRRIWYVAEHRDAKSRRVSESELRRKLRGNDFSGMELARPDGAEAWTPLHELPIFAQEVPVEGHPRHVALRREVRSLFGHAAIFAGVLGVTGGYAEWWGWLWGAFFGYHAFRALPHLLELWRSRSGAASGAVPERAMPPELAAFGRELERVRALADERGGSAREDLLGALDSLSAHVVKLFRTESELASLTEEETARGLDAEQAELDAQRGTLGPGDGPQRALLDERGRMLASRREALGQAHRSLETLRQRRRLAEDQVRLLRLELTSLDAARSDAPVHRERLAAMRHELGALQELDAVLGDPPAAGAARELEG